MSLIHLAIKMELSDYSYGFGQIGNCAFEIFVIKKDGTKFCHQVGYRGGNPPDELIFNVFKDKHKDFFLDIEAEIVKDAPVVTVAPENIAINESHIN